MTSGGARVRSGPPPDPNALRRDRDSAQWLHLPASGRPGLAPEWPRTAYPRPTTAEIRRWEELWQRPEAIAWELYRLEWLVARCIRWEFRAQKPKAAASFGDQAKSMADELGLTPGGRAKNRWAIGDTPQPRQEPAQAPAAVVDIRDRFRAVGE